MGPCGPDQRSALLLGGKSRKDEKEKRRAAGSLDPVYHLRGDHYTAEPDADQKTAVHAEAVLGLSVYPCRKNDYPGGKALERIVFYPCGTDAFCKWGFKSASGRVAEQLCRILRFLTGNERLWARSALQRGLRSLKRGDHLPRSDAQPL